MLSAELTTLVMDASGQMALDEAMLVRAPAGALALRFYRWAGPACTFGYSQPYRAVCLACNDRGWKDVSPVRRATGGGIVYHDGDVTFSLIFPWERIWAPDAIYKNVHRAVHLGLKEAGVATSLYSPQRRHLGAAAACFTRAEPMDLISDDHRKILGGALRKRGTKGLYQGSLRMENLSLSREAAQVAITNGLEREFGRRPSLEIAPDWRAAGEQLVKKYRSVDWNQRR